MPCATSGFRQVELDPTASQGPHKIVPRATDTMLILFMLVVD